ncbi:galactoside-binding lectin, partial [Ancylostoma caninum]
LITDSPLNFVGTVISTKLPLVVPVTSFVVGDKLRVVLQPGWRTTHDFHIRLKNGSEVVLSFKAHTLETEDYDPNPAHITFNTCRNGVWESEERIAGRCKFVSTQTYFIDFCPSGHHSVYVRVNGRNIHEFRERHSGFKVSSLEIDGDLTVHSVHVT